MRHPLADRTIVAASVDRALEWWEADPSEIRRPQGSALHKLVEDWKAGIVVMPNSARPWQQELEDMILGANQVFLVQHDWAAALGHVVDFAALEYRLPFEQCAFEFDVSGHRVIYIEREDGEAVLAIHSVRHWCAFPVEPDDAFRQDQSTGLASILRIAAENVRAMTIVLDAGAAQTRRIEAPAALNKARRKARKGLISDYYVLDLSRVRSDRVAAPADGPRKRLHFRRGHWRQVDGVKTWVRWTLAGNADLGFIDKRYRL